MPRQYRSEERAMNRVKSDVVNRGVWTAIIRKVDVDGKPYWVLSFDCMDESDDYNV